jgi:hypothetical protein
MAIAPAMKSIAKATLPRSSIEYLKRMRLRLRGETWPAVPFDNQYPWLNYTFSELLKLTKGAYPQYAWGVTQGAALAKVLGLPRVSVIEFGVAGGYGLLALEKISKVVERETNIGIDVFWFRQWGWLAETTGLSGSAEHVVRRSIPHGQSKARPQALPRQIVSWSGEGNNTTLHSGKSCTSRICRLRSRSVFVNS